jgi:Domain of unknown function (DUF1906)
MTVFGVDYAWGRPGVAALKRVGTAFVCRYLSHDATGKNLTRAESEELSGAGLWLVVVWESTAARALQGNAAGVADAKAAATQAASCGMPDDRPIYFAVDWDASSSQQGSINAYLDGAASVLGRDRVGLYAGYGPISRAFNAGKITFGWQTYGWSGSNWDARAQLQQYSNDHTINGVSCDYDRATHDDYGQWKVGESPMALTADDINKLWNWDGIPAPDGSKTNPTWKPSSVLIDIDKRLMALQAAVAKVPTTQVDPAAVAKQVLAGLDAKAIADAVTAALPADEAKKVADELAARLAS